MRTGALPAGTAPPASGPVAVYGGGRSGGGSTGAGDGTHAHLAATIGITLGLAAVAMFFLALASAFVVRHGLGQEWGGFPVPRLLWLNTAVLAASSVCAERARRIAPIRASAGAGWAGITLALGLLFLGGQALAWSRLAASGLTVGVTPFSSFLWLFTGAHAVHLAGGLLALAASAALPLEPARRSRWIHVAAIYWHFMGVLWLGLFALLVIWR